MNRYSRAVEELEEYEEDGYVDAEGEEYEEEDPAPKKEVVEYLAMRQKFKEAARKKMARENDSGSSSRDRRKSQLENFGSFFGPSQPVIADRVIQESKSLLETRRMEPRVSSHQKDSTKRVNGASTSAPLNGTRERRLQDPIKTKVQKLKNTRDYSFLQSDDANVPIAPKNLPARGNSDSRSAQVSSKIREFDRIGRNSVSIGHEQRRVVSVNSHSRPVHSQANQKMNPGSRPDPRKPERALQKPSVGRVSGSSRPGLPKDWDAKKASPSVEKKARPHHMDSKAGLNSSQRRGPDGGSVSKPSSSMVARGTIPNGQRPASKSQNGALKHSMADRRIMQEPSMGRVLSKQSLPSKPQLTRTPNPKQHIPSRGRSEEDYYRSKPKPKPKRDPEVDQAMLELRKMIGPRGNHRYSDDDADSSDMEADFSTIQREEKRSARIAKEEDEKEAKLIAEEEERERRRKLAKRKR